MRDHMRPMHNQADPKIYESEQRENTKRHRTNSTEPNLFHRRETTYRVG